jgi:hypothetical protein
MIRIKVKTDDGSEFDILIPKQRTLEKGNIKTDQTKKRQTKPRQTKKKRGGYSILEIRKKMKRAKSEVLRYPLRPVSQIARNYGVHTSTIYKHCKKELKMRKRLTTEKIKNNK